MVGPPLLRLSQAGLNIHKWLHDLNDNFPEKVKEWAFNIANGINDAVGIMLDNDEYQRFEEFVTSSPGDYYALSQGPNLPGPDWPPI